MLKSSMPRSLAGYFVAAMLLCAALVGDRPAYARPQDTGFLNRVITINGTTYHYVVYLPMDYSPKQKWPVVLFLHGSGERGSDGLDETQVGLPNALRSHYER